MALQSIELFAGAGGLALGAGRAGFKPVKVVEYNKDCRATLALNAKRANGPLNDWPDTIGRDVQDQDYREFEGKVALVSGGPPCQPFSMGGRHNAQADRRDMFPEAVRAVREARPEAFLFENVKGLTRQSFVAYFEYIRLQLQHPHLVAKQDEDWSDHLRRLENHHTGTRDTDEDYRVIAQVLNAADYGVPQQRHRVFFVGIRSDLGRSYAFPKATHSRVALAADIAAGRYADRVGVKASQLALPPQMRRTIASMSKPGKKTADAEELKPWKTTREALADLPEPKVNGVDGWLNHLKRDGAKAYPGHTGSDLDYPIQGTQGRRPRRPWRREHDAPRQRSREILHRARERPPADLPGRLRGHGLVERGHAPAGQRRARRLGFRGG